MSDTAHRDSSVTIEDIERTEGLIADALVKAAALSQSMDEDIRQTAEFKKTLPSRSDFQEKLSRADPDLLDKLAAEIKDYAARAELGINFEPEQATRQARTKTAMRLMMRGRKI